MADLQLPPGLDPRFTWLRFRGKLRSRERGVVTITPEGDDDLQLQHAADDVAVAKGAGNPGEVYVKSGAKRLGRLASAGSSYAQRPFGMSTSQQCGGKPSECIGGVEYCCDTNVAVGECPAETQCP